MDILLDTHAFLWFVTGDKKLSKKSKDAISPPENTVFLSMATIWEMAIKFSLGKIKLALSFEKFISEQININSFDILQITLEHVFQTATMPFHHRDPL